MSGVTPGSATPDGLPAWLRPQWQQLQDNARTGRLGHAILLSGPAGVGKHLLADELRRLALCGERAVPACGRCRSCQVAAAGNHPDDHALRLPDDKKIIGVDPVRELIVRLGLASGYGNRKFGLITPAESMNANAANALLKTLEEPPGDTLLVLVTHRMSRLPATVISRCQVVQCGAPSVSVGRAFLTSALESDEGDVCLMLSGGAPFQALDYYNQGVEGIYSDVIEDIVRLRDGSADLVSVASAWTDEHLDVRLLCLYAISRQLTFEALDLEGELAHKSDLKSLRTGTEGIKLSAMFGYQDAVVRARSQLDSPLNQQLALEKLLAPWSDGFRTYALEYRNL